MENTEQLPMDGVNKTGWVNGTGKLEKKKQRNNTKGLQRKIKKQMEFYFPKLNQYKFMKQHLDNAPDGYVPLFPFLKFASILKLTSSTEAIAKALETSSLLEISKDKTKVRRTQPVHHMAEEEADEKTVYVEGLPPTADHNWIAQCFSSCGKVTFVSLPRYKTTGVIKGFAFVEFATPVEAANAIKEMNVSGLPSDKMKEMNTKDEEMNEQKQGKGKKLMKEPPRLRVMSKNEWSRLRSQYLDQQRASMASHKQLQHSTGHRKSGPSLHSAPKFQPSVIVEIKSEDPMSHKQLKQQIQSDIKVAYIDVKDNMLHGYIRCKDAESAQTLVASNLTGCTLHLVQGKKESKYWNKIQMDRMSKWANSKRPKKKGSSKILEKVKSFMLQSMEKSHILIDGNLSERHDKENGIKAKASTLPSSKMNHAPKSEGDLHKVANIKPSKKQALKEGIGLPCNERQEVGKSRSTTKQKKSDKEMKEKNAEKKKLEVKEATKKSSEQPELKEDDGRNAKGRVQTELKQIVPRKAKECHCNERQEVGKSKITTKQKKSDKEMKEKNAEKKKLEVKEATKKSSEQPELKEADIRKGKQKSTDRTEADCAKKSKSEASDKMEEMTAKDGKTRKKLKNDPHMLKVMSEHECSRPKSESLDQQQASMASHKQPLHSICNNVVQGTKHGMVSSYAGDQKSAPGLCSAFKFQSNVIVEIKSEGPMSQEQLKILEQVKSLMLQSMKKSHILIKEDLSERHDEKWHQSSGFNIASSKMNHAPKSEGELHKVANIKPSKKQALQEVLECLVMRDRKLANQGVKRNTKNVTKK
ncbi:la-related protein 7-like isoform X2 [Pomacea canaliculata]|uniref:la-related protein 7-like isoform X2 n=1 Tax=Pomacea canaliculata TaxID=400727 RepID=UPI000D7260B3|nr:la-related protein 7-like isoform X2 [Pomacea canaliculata]